MLSAQPAAVAAWHIASDKATNIPWFEGVRAGYPARSEYTSIDGVEAYAVTPAKGITAGNEGRVLINVHGGGLMMGWLYAGQAEAALVAAIMGVKVYTINYTQYPKGRFPDGSKDVAAVFRALLKPIRRRISAFTGCPLEGT